MTVHNRFARRWMQAVVACGAVAAAGAASGAARAQTLEQALAQAYSTNPALTAQLAALRAADERVSQALAGYRPTLKGTLSAGRQTTDSRISSPTSGGTVGADSGGATSPKQAALTATQPLYDATVGPSVRRSENLVQAQRATVVNTEETVLLNAASAYLDVVRNQAILTLNTNNEQVLRRQLEAARDRFRVGEYTRTDVSQSESRLAGAIATRISSDGTLQASRGTYERVIGSAPGATLKAPKPTFKMPANVDETVALAQANSPPVLIAVFNEASQRDTVDQQFGRLLPSANLQASVGRSWDVSRSRSSGLTSNTDRTDTASITAQVVIPLYQAGLPEALVREAKHTANQYRLQIDDARRAAAETAIKAWQALTTARASIESYQSQINAAKIALDGVRQEAQVGSRTVLDVLNQEQELLNARVNLVGAQYSEMVAAFQVLSAVGQLTAEQLHLPVQYYDMDRHYKAVRDKWIGTGIDE